MKQGLKQALPGNGRMEGLVAADDGVTGMAPLTAGAIMAGLVATVALAYLLTDNVMIALLLAAAMLFFAALIWFYVSMVADDRSAEEFIADWTITAAVADQSNQLIAITDRAGRLVCANGLYAEIFGDYLPPTDLKLDSGSDTIVQQAGRAAWRDGDAQADSVRHLGNAYELEVLRIGRGDDHLLWRFRAVLQASLVEEAKRLVGGFAGRAAGEAGLITAVVGPEGRIRSANSAFALRAVGDGNTNLIGRDFASFLRVDDAQNIFFEREGQTGPALQLVHIPLADQNGSAERRESDHPALLLLLDRQEVSARKGAELMQVELMFSLLPFGLAMVNRDGRFLFANGAFTRASGLDDEALPPYPGDLVIAEDKAALADTIRRFASGPPQGGDLAVRLKHQPDEPISLNVAGVRGLGDAAVLLSLRDNSEEATLKRQVAQATKMQAVGQLAGGVAHDFNNVLTAILGHCDLMLLRHSPGDGDYDDIQQIKNNSARAASLTRQLLAFSRQQTLRPQILQLPDVIAETSHLLNRLIGEKVTLEVRHDRNLGAIRADPGQLEQVIMNLAVNARDAMPDGGILAIETRRVSSGDVRAMNSDILPVADYSAIVVRDEGCGISAENQAKIFEPFFTTKDVGKGTGLGLSTVYGIVKQSGGYIFVDSAIGRGTSFTLYFPVHDIRGETAAEPEGKTLYDPPDEPNDYLGGSGTILLVEDEDMVRAVAERALTRQGYSVITAGDGEDGLEQFAAHDNVIDLVISDVVMPVMDGPAMARIIRERAPDVPLIFMSGYAEEQLRKSIDVDNMGFLPKPFSVAQICESAGQALRRSREKA
ncbi:MAG: response regulator [Pseudomonadota bacterium]